MAPPGLYRMPLPLPPLVGLPAVNVYVLEGPDGLILIDAGWASQEAYDRLGGQGGLAELGGHRLGDIDTFVITHAHWDHYSLASRVRQDHPQVGWWSVAASGRRSRDTPPRSGSTAARVRNCAGTARPRSPTRGRQDREAYERDVPFDAPSRYLAEGDRLPLADGSLQIEETPGGHTKGHLTVRWPAAGMLFTGGDHVLPNATPALAMELVPDEHPLRTYLDSLRRTRPTRMR